MRWVLVAALALAGCPGAGDTRVDGGVDPEHLGAHVTWNARHPNTIPGQAVNGVQIETARFSLNEVRLVGDAGTATVERLMLGWSEGTAPDPLTFVDAPAGLFSRIVFELGATGDGRGRPAFELTGTARVGNDDAPFRITDAQDLNVAVGFKKVTLPPGGECDVRVKIDFKKIIDRVDFDDLPIVGGVRVLDEDSPFIDAVRRAVREELFTDMDDDGDN